MYLSDLHALQHIHLGFERDASELVEIEENAVEQVEQHVSLLRRSSVQPALQRHRAASTVTVYTSRQPVVLINVRLSVLVLIDIIVSLIKLFSVRVTPK